eukprot:TRINITY_DN980_c3_g1_i1.p1 TRINITY_DN980_c3_g1~~TRINITY_DN980_c3_g1_i1.p1  ORF type:complete len:159 (-),score=57.57 TRINITY_DN980_c3_g1_i1:103-579(-)
MNFFDHCGFLFISETVIDVSKSAKQKENLQSSVIWKVRWCTLQKGVLSFRKPNFSSNEPNNKFCHIELARGAHIRISKVKIQSYSFSITSLKKKYEFMAFNESEFQNWIKALTLNREVDQRADPLQQWEKAELRVLLLSLSNVNANQYQSPILINVFN